MKRPARRSFYIGENVTDDRPLPSRTLGRTASNEEEQRSEGSSIESEDIEVLIPDELEEYTDKIVFGKLSKQGFGSSLSLSKLAFYCVAVSYAASLQNFTLFNNLIHRRGFFFVIPFCFCMYSIAFPLTYFELALGQYTQTSILAIFDNIAPIGFGIGLSALFLVVISVVISNDLLALMVAVLVNSYEVFGIGILWDNCIGPLSREHCVSFERSCNDFDKIGRSPLNALTYPLPRAQHLGDTCVLSYVPSIRSRLAEYEKQQFTESLPLVHYGLSGFDDFHSLRIVVYPYMAFLGYIPLGFCLLALMLSHLRGLVPSLAYAYLFITSLLTITLLAFAVFMSPPSYPSTETFYRVDLSIDVWLEAALMSCVIMQLGYGGIIFLGSQNTFFNDIATDSMIIVTATTVVFTCQASLYALIRDSFFFESAHGDTPYFREVSNLQSLCGNCVKATIIRNFMSDEVNFDRGDVVALVVILSPIPVCAFYRCWTFYHYNLNWRRLFTPEPELWGPRLTYHRILAERDEKRLRV
ncbi:hypothetical protein Q1695_010110 [Nippostrongylus brasiliensis]|nr:hypothetical protein Q1695_010110 [Nippostrongylus brasiliensis]